MTLEIFLLTRIAKIIIIIFILLLNNLVVIDIIGITCYDYCGHSCHYSDIIFSLSLIRYYQNHKTSNCNIQVFLETNRSHLLIFQLNYHFSISSGWSLTHWCGSLRVVPPLLLVASTQESARVSDCFHDRFIRWWRPCGDAFRSQERDGIYGKGCNIHQKMPLGLIVILKRRPGQTDELGVSERAGLIYML